MNQYLEKIASSRLKRWDQSNGNLGAGMSSAELNTKFTGASPSASIASGSKHTVNRISSFPSFGKKMVADGSVKTTGDSTVTGKSLEQRLSDKKTGAFVPASSKSNIPGSKPPSTPIKAGEGSLASKGGGILNKVLSIAKKSPVKTLAGVGGLAFAAGRMSKGNNNGSSY